MIEHPPALQDQARYLSALEAPAEVRAGHHDLFPGLWLSTDPKGEGRMTLHPLENGFRLTLDKGDSGAWACIGLQIRPEVLKPARYLGLMATLGGAGGAMVALQPMLRYFHGDHMEDVPSAAPLLLTSGAGPRLTHMPLDPDKLESAGGCEVNLFFTGDGFEADFTQLEPLLIL